MVPAEGGVMGRTVHSHTEWCIIRFHKGRFERARDGYKSAENAQKSIPSVAKAYIEEGGGEGATYAIGSYTVGEVVVRSGFGKPKVA